MKKLNLTAINFAKLLQSAYELGLENEAYFSRFFKKATGFSPREFVKRNVY
jgi:YesN/AraC family two-component response regulator